MDQVHVIVAKPSGKVGTSTAVDLYYEAAGTRYLLHFPYGFTVRGDGRGENDAGDGQDSGFQSRFGHW